MNIKKTYIPAKFRNPKLVNSGGSNTTVQGGGSSTEGHTHNNKPVIDQLTQADINVLAKLSLIDGNLKVDTNLYSTGEVSAYGLGEGSGGGGGGGSLVTWGTTTNNFSPLTVEGISKTVALQGHTHTKAQVGLSNVDNVKQLPLSQKGAVGGVAELDENGKVLASQLPSYVDDVLEYANLAGFPTTGETGKIYTALDTNKIYRWGGTTYIEISSSLALGETSSTAYRGDRGKIAYEHSQSAHAPANAQKNSDITKAEIEAKLTGNISSHTHTVTKADVGLDNVLNVASYSKTETDSLINSINVGVTSIGLTAPTGFSVSNSPITSTGNIALAFATGYSLPTTAKQANWDTAFTNSHTHANKTQLDLITQSNIDVLAKLSIVNGNLQIDGNAYATGELSAYGAGDGSGGGGGIIETVYGYGNLGQTFNNSILTDTFNAYTINQINTRLVAVENGSATTVNTTGTGNAITSISKAGSVITANKGLTFSLSTHNHDTLYKPIGYVPTWGEVTGKPATFAPSAHTHPISDITNLQTTLNNKLETSIFNTHNNDNIRHITGAERTKWDGVVTDFGNLEIGGRNLIIGSTERSIMLMYGVTGTYESVINTSVPSGVIFKGSNLVRTTGNYAFFIPITNARTRFKVANGERVLVSFYIKTNNNQTLTAPGYNLYTSVGAEWKRVEHIFIYPSSGNLHYELIGAGLSSFEIHSIKMERGNKPTDWTPAPEDQVSDWSTTDVNSFSFIKNKPTLLSQFTDNIGVATHIANKTNPHSVTKAQVGLGNVDNTSDLNKPISTATQNALNLKANLASPTFTGNVNVAGTIRTSGGVGVGRFAIRDNMLEEWYTASDEGSIGANFYGYNGGATYFRNFRIFNGKGSEIMRIVGSTANVGIGTTNPQYKLDVSGTGRFTGNLTAPSYNTANWKWEQVGTELQLKYNNVVAQRFLLDGSIVGLGEITAYGATTGGEGVALLRSGGTMTGNLTMSADIIMNSGRSIGKSNLPLKLLGNALTYNASNILTEANTANQIKMGNGWTIEQTTSALTIKKNGVIKGTFNA